jgi:hypothetical protein
MSKFVVAASASALLCVTAFRFFNQAKDTSTGTSQTQAIVTATSVFLSSLSVDQRQKVQFLFTPQKTPTAAKFARTGGLGGPGGPGRGRPMQGPDARPGTPGEQTVSVLPVAKVQGEVPAVLVWGRGAVSVSLENSMGKQSGRIIQLVTCLVPVCVSAT